MEDLTFGEQVKIILGRKGMTIKELAESIEEKTGKKMSRQNLTQRLGRDNFQEQDMRMIAEILGCPFHLSIMSGEMMQKKEETQSPAEKVHGDVQDEQIQGEDLREKEDASIKENMRVEEKEISIKESVQAEEEGISIKESAQAGETEHSEERDITIGELYDIHRELSKLEEDAEKPEKHQDEPAKDIPDKERDEKQEGFEPVIPENDLEEDRVNGEINPYTGREYQSNSVRMHPSRIGYVQVYDRKIHKWTDMTEWAFLGYQERKKALLGTAYVPPIYLD